MKSLSYVNDINEIKSRLEIDALRYRTRVLKKRNIRKRVHPTVRPYKKQQVCCFIASIFWKVLWTTRKEVCNSVSTLAVETCNNYCSRWQKYRPSVKWCNKRDAINVYRRWAPLCSSQLVIVAYLVLKLVMVYFSRQLKLLSDIIISILIYF